MIEKGGFQLSQEAIHSQMKAWRSAWCFLTATTCILIPFPLL